MSARDAIDIIKTLSTSEVKEVAEFIKTLDDQPVRFASYDLAMKISDDIMNRNEELFQKLAQ
ncbi:MAG: hypothetical protein JWO94_311 [Verrucomicrobiaceae bacterium]|nr:hypothetical protein [Verrucomicrobiaceae bacterium]